MGETACELSLGPGEHRFKLAVHSRIETEGGIVVVLPDGTEVYYVLCGVEERIDPEHIYSSTFHCRGRHMFGYFREATVRETLTGLEILGGVYLPQGGSIQASFDRGNGIALFELTGEEAA